MQPSISIDQLTALGPRQFGLWRAAGIVTLRYRQRSDDYWCWRFRDELWLAAVALLQAQARDPETSLSVDEAEYLCVQIREAVGQPLPNVARPPAQLSKVATEQEDQQESRWVARWRRWVARLWKRCRSGRSDRRVTAT